LKTSTPPPGTPVDFRGTPLRVGDIVAYPDGYGRSKCLNEGVIKKLGPKTATVLDMDSIRYHEKVNDTKVTRIEHLAEMNTWSNRLYNCVVRLGNIEDQP